ncbi:MAG: NYN domain-containing protein [bacterium]|nr:NYN domain-containing protein [bacterium]
MAEQNEEIALYIDFENLAHGFDRGKDGAFDIGRVLARLVEKGKVVMKRAYCDWSRYAKYKQELHEAGIELVEVPRRSMTGKNSADIRLVVDAMDLCYGKEHIGTFVIASGDSDFSPLVSKLKENGKHVIGLGVKNSTSDLLVANCDEFIFYENLGTEESSKPGLGHDIPKEKREAFELLFESIDAHMRENLGILWSSIVKETMKRKRPSFSERAHGYKSFSDLLEDAQRKGFIQLKRDERSGSYIILSFGRSIGNEDAAEAKPKRTARPRRTPAARKSGAPGRKRASAAKGSGGDKAIAGEDGSES